MTRLIRCIVRSLPREQDLSHADTFSLDQSHFSSSANFEKSFSPRWDANSLLDRRILILDCDKNGHKFPTLDLSPKHQLSHSVPPTTFLFDVTRPPFYDHSHLLHNHWPDVSFCSSRFLRTKRRGHDCSITFSSSSVHWESAQV